jgi:hypothetical protein
MSLVQLADLAVDAHAAEALARRSSKSFVYSPLRPSTTGASTRRAVPALGQDLVGHLVGGLALDHAPALGAVRGAHARVQQAKVVIDLGDGAHRGARVLRGRLLVDGDGRREALDAVEVGLVHLPQELARIAGEALNVAALPLRVDGVEGEARLARAREAGYDAEPVARDVYVHVAQVVLARAAYLNAIGRHGPAFRLAVVRNLTV